MSLGSSRDPARASSLRALAERLGVDEDEIERAERDGTVGLVIVDHLVVPEPGVYTQDEIIARSGLGEEARRFWHALGFPDPPPEERSFSQIDLEMLQLLDALLRLNLVEQTVALQLARVIGSSMARVAQAQIDAIESRIDTEVPDAEATLAVVAGDEELAVQRAGMLLPTMPRILEYSWRRHLRSAARRRMVREAMAAGGAAAVTVGFADLVGFTALSQQLSDTELADVVDRFEATAYDVVTASGGRVVKTIGDEVMFETPDPTTGVGIGLALAEAYRDDEQLSDVRVGLASGPVLEREGDLFGPTVNLASRIVSIAYAGSVVVSQEVRDALRDDPRFTWKALRTRQLKHIGRVGLHVVRHADDDFEREGTFDRAWRRRGAIRDKVADLLERRAGGEEE